MSSKPPERSASFADLLARVSRELANAHIPYMVIGGQAVLVYGEPRFTQDVNITLGLNLSGVAQILDLALRLQLEVLVPNPEEFVSETYVLPVRDRRSGIRVDIVFSLSGFEREAIARAQTFSFGGEEVKFVSLEDLLVLKTIAGRPRDLEDLKGLIAKNPQLDREHVLRWLREYDQEFGEGFEDRFIQVATAVTHRGN